MLGGFMLFLVCNGTFRQPADHLFGSGVKTSVIHIQQITQPEQHGNKAGMRIVRAKTVGLIRKLQHLVFRGGVTGADLAQQLQQAAAHQAAVSKVDLQPLGDALNVAFGHGGMLAAEIGSVDELDAADDMEGPQCIILLACLHFAQPLYCIAQIFVFALGKRSEIVLKRRVRPGFL